MKLLHRPEAGKTRVDFITRLKPNMLEAVQISIISVSNEKLSLNRPPCLFSVRLSTGAFEAIDDAQSVLARQFVHKG